MRSLKGIPAAPGLAEGKAQRLPSSRREVPHYRVENIHREKNRLQTALETAEQQLAALADKVSAQGGESAAGVFEAQRMFISDPALLGKVEKLLERGENAEFAWHEACEFYARQIEALGDETLKARAADVRDVAQRVVGILSGAEANVEIEAGSVILANDLTPSQTATLDTSKVKAFCTAEGGPTSHTAILAKALGIPAVVGLGKTLLETADGTVLLVDGSRGQVILEADQTTRAAFKLRLAEEEKTKQAALAEAHQPAITADGRAVHIAANIGSVEEAATAKTSGAEGIGLLRTEFLFIGRDRPPDEETQTQAYKAILEAFGDAPVVVRTLDVGGDKEIPYLKLEAEANPYLGYRAIRISLNEPEAFKLQLRALLRASPAGNLRVMFPMIATLDELRQAKALLEEARREVLAAGGEVAENLQVGMMVEVPAAALMADRFAAEVDFFSIGTNDLTQYTFAAERGNPRVAQLNDPCHPAVLRLIESIVQAAQKAQIWCGVCGEMAGDPQAIPLLLGLGVEELSMSPGLIPQTKEIVRAWKLENAQKLAQAALNLENAAQVRALTTRIS